MVITLFIPDGPGLFFFEQLWKHETWWLPEPWYAFWRSSRKSRWIYCYLSLFMHKIWEKCHTGSFEFSFDWPNVLDVSIIKTTKRFSQKTTFLFPVWSNFHIIAQTQSRLRQICFTIGKMTLNVQRMSTGGAATVLTIETG